MSLMRRIETFELMRKIMRALTVFLLFQGASIAAEAAGGANASTTFWNGVTQLVAGPVSYILVGLAIVVSVYGFVRGEIKWAFIGIGGMIFISFVKSLTIGYSHLQTTLFSMSLPYYGAKDGHHEFARDWYREVSYLAIVGSSICYKVINAGLSSGVIPLVAFVGGLIAYYRYSISGEVKHLFRYLIGLILVWSLCIDPIVGIRYTGIQGSPISSLLPRTVEELLFRNNDEANSSINIPLLPACILYGGEQITAVVVHALFSRDLESAGKRAVLRAAANARPSERAKVEYREYANMLAHTYAKAKMNAAGSNSARYSYAQQILTQSPQGRANMFFMPVGTTTMIRGLRGVAVDMEPDAQGLEALREVALNVYTTTQGWRLKADTSTTFPTPPWLVTWMRDVCENNSFTVNQWHERAERNGVIGYIPALAAALLGSRNAIANADQYGWANKTLIVWLDAALYNYDSRPRLHNQSQILDYAASPVLIAKHLPWWPHESTGNPYRPLFVVPVFAAPPDGFCVFFTAQNSGQRSFLQQNHVTHASAMTIDGSGDAWRIYAQTRKIDNQNGGKVSIWPNGSMSVETESHANFPEAWATEFINKISSGTTQEDLQKALRDFGVPEMALQGSPTSFLRQTPWGNAVYIDYTSYLHAVVLSDMLDGMHTKCPRAAKEVKNSSDLWGCLLINYYNHNQSEQSWPSEVVQAQSVFNRYVRHGALSKLNSPWQSSPYNWPGDSVAVDTAVANQATWYDVYVSAPGIASELSGIPVGGATSNPAADASASWWKQILSFVYDAFLVMGLFIYRILGAILDFIAERVFGYIIGFSILLLFIAYPVFATASLIPGRVGAIFSISQGFLWAALLPIPCAIGYYLTDSSVQSAFEEYRLSGVIDRTNVELLVGIIGNLMIILSPVIISSAMSLSSNSVQSLASTPIGVVHTLVGATVSVLATAAAAVGGAAAAAASGVGQLAAAGGTKTTSGAGASGGDGGAETASNASGTTGAATSGAGASGKAGASTSSADTPQYAASSKDGRLGTVEKQKEGERAFARMQEARRLAAEAVFRPAQAAAQGMAQIARAAGAQSDFGMQQTAHEAGRVAMRRIELDEAAWRRGDAAHKIRDPELREIYMDQHGVNLASRAVGYDRQTQQKFAEASEYFRMASNAKTKEERDALLARAHEMVGQSMYAANRAAYLHQQSGNMIAAAAATNRAADHVIALYRAGWMDEASALQFLEDASQVNKTAAMQAAQQGNLAALRQAQYRQSWQEAAKADIAARESEQAMRKAAERGQSLLTSANLHGLAVDERSGTLQAVGGQAKDLQDRLRANAESAKLVREHIVEVEDRIRTISNTLHSLSQDDPARAKLEQELKQHQHILGQAKKKEENIMQQYQADDAALSNLFRHASDILNSDTEYSAMVARARRYQQMVTDSAVRREQSLNNTSGNAVHVLENTDWGDVIQATKAVEEIGGIGIATAGSSSSARAARERIIAELATSGAAERLSQTADGRAALAMMYGAIGSSMTDEERTYLTGKYSAAFATVPMPRSLSDAASSIDIEHLSPGARSALAQVVERIHNDVRHIERAGVRDTWTAASVIDRAFQPNYDIAAAAFASEQAPAGVVQVTQGRLSEVSVEHALAGVVQVTPQGRSVTMKVDAQAMPRPAERPVNEVSASRQG